MKMVKRTIESEIIENLSVFPAVVLLGSRQCGKSTLIKMMSDAFQSFIYLDLQNPADLSKLNDSRYFFDTYKDSTICIDEIQLAPELFSVLRSAIDFHRKPGRFILLGSASRDLVQHTSESLAGRVGLVDLTPFVVDEVKLSSQFNLQEFWIRGGYPDSYLATSDKASVLWRDNFIRTYVERDIPQLGYQIPALQMRRMMMMLAHVHGQVLNLSKLAESLNVTHPTIRKYIDLLEQTYVVRSLSPYENNLKKRLVKSPKIFLRDSGLLHSLLQINDFNQLMGHPVYGSSWEGMVVENVLTNFKQFNASFYRTASGVEVDLVLEKANDLYLIECKASSSPVLSKGFWVALDDLSPKHTYILAPVTSTYKMKENITVCNLVDFKQLFLNDLHVSPQ